MDQTPNLNLPYIMPAQAQKHVTHNEAIRALDAIVQIAVIDRDLSAPPASPADGDRYIVAAGATGSWTGHDGQLAAFQDGAWSFYPPQEGWLAWVADEDALLAFDGAAWLTAGGGTVSVNPAPLVGVNTTADATNRLAVKSDATLFSHDDITPGTGDMRQVLNKSAGNKTVSQLYQSNWSGRAETGLTGDDNFHVKVSPDGNTWHDAILIDRATGRVSFPAAPRREVLSANRTYYVSTSGNDNNSGLSAGTPFATIAKAWQILLQLDLNGLSVTISLAPGVYAPFTATGALVGQSSVTSVQLQGAGASTEIAAPGTASAIIVQNGAQITVRDLKVSSATGNGLWAQTGGRINIHGGLDFGQANAHMRADLGGLVTNNFASAYTISGPANYHVWGNGGDFSLSAPAVTVTGTPAFTAFAIMQSGSKFSAFGHTYTGTATGRRYQALLGGLINTFGGGANYFPGDVAGTTGTGGQYA